MPTVGGLDETYRLIKPQMDALERLLADILRDDIPCVDEMLRYAARYSGKRLRPALVFLVGSIVGPLNEKHVQLGAVVEMIHMATLVHDDVLDRATMRRSAASLNVRWNNKDAVLLGDIMFARAIRLLVDIGHVRALELLTTAVSTICEGEIHQNQLSHVAQVDVETYLDIIRKKTASLYAGSCELAAMFSGADDDLVQSFSDYGMSLGTAFQIIDDCLDLTGDESVVGKSLGTDIKNGKMTLPLIHLLGSIESSERAFVVETIAGRNQSTEAVARVRDLLTQHDSITFALSEANRFVRESLARLRRRLSPTNYAIVEAIADFVLNRQN